MPAERLVGGLHCSQVLERLSDYLDGELTTDEVAAVHAHLGGCAECTRFGGEFAAVIRRLRAGLGADEEDAPEDAVRRLSSSLG